MAETVQFRPQLRLETVLFHYDAPLATNSILTSTEVDVNTDVN